MLNSGGVWDMPTRDLAQGPFIGHLCEAALTASDGRKRRHDGAVSVAAGFTRREVLDIARRVGLSNIKYRRHLFGRFTLVSTD